MAPLKAAEILVHPAFSTIEWDLPPTREGYCDVALGRPGGPFKLYWEIHGQGEVKIVVGTEPLLKRASWDPLRGQRSGDWPIRHRPSTAARPRRITLYLNYLWTSISN